VKVDWAERIDVDPARYLASRGGLFAVFDARTQDSGNVSYGVEIDGERFFVKTAGAPGSVAHLEHAARVALLDNAARIARIISHAALAPLHTVVESPHGPMLVYAWGSGELLGVPRARRDDPACAFQRFRALPVPQILAALDVVFGVHERLAQLGYVAVDFYDGALLYDFASGRITVVDIDHYHPGPFRNEVGRLFGSTRFMAPEEFVLGAVIDERTNVFTMGRTVRVFVDDIRLTPHLLDVAARACAVEPAARFPSMAAFCAAWRAARLATAP
jgi:serine/threonine-protein kinase